MGFPVTYHIIFVMLSIVFFIMVMLLLFIDVTFDRAIAAFILCFINGVVSGVASAGFFAFDLFGFDASGVLVSNMVSDYAFLGIVFIIFVYMSVILMVYCLWVFYKKPWDATAKIEYNPYVAYK